ncbi:MAG: ATP synthase F1 subunit delta [Proteobacteria bacterium]|nr:ATP synthase F1 subunit delta [Pseudomonadota bacterium]
MKSDSTAQKYAEALFGIGTSQGKLEVFQANAVDFQRILDSSKELMIALSHPNIRKTQRKEVINGVLAGSTYDPLFINFVKLVVDRGRIQYFSKIMHSFVGLRDAAVGRLRGVVYVAEPLTADQHDRLRAKAQSKLGCEVVLEERIDPSIIGGLRLEINGRVYDSSVKRHLERLREAMKDAR